MKLTCLQNSAYLNYTSYMQLFLGWLLVIAVAGTALGPTVNQLRRGKLDLFEIRHGFCLYYACALSFSFIPVLVRGEASFLGPQFPQEFAYYIMALILSWWGIICFHLGFSACSRSLLVPSALLRPWSRSRLSFSIGACSMGGYIGIAVWLSKYDWNLASAQLAWRGDGMKEAGYLTFLASKVPLISALLLVGDRIGKRGLRWIDWVFLIVTLIPTFLLGFRSLFILPIVSLLAVWNYAVRPIRMMSIVIYCILLAAASVVYDSSRNFAVVADVSFSDYIYIDLADSFGALTLIERVKGVEIVAAEIEKLRVTSEFRYFVPGVFELTTIVIPRAIWKGKPLSSGEVFTTYFFGEKFKVERNAPDRDVWGGISPTAVGDFYWHAGITGVTVGLFCLGWIFRIVGNTLNRYRRTPSVIVAYAIVLPNAIGMTESVQGYSNSLLLTLGVGVMVLILLSSQHRALKNCS